MKLSMSREEREAFLAGAAPLANEVLVVLRPERWWSVDFSRMSLR